MLKIFILLSTLIIWTLALIDVKNIIKDSDIASSRTPAQIEIKSPINNKSIKPNSLNIPDFNNNNQNKFKETNKNYLQENLNKINKQQTESQPKF